jgi:hypothetical protein
MNYRVFLLQNTDAFSSLVVVTPPSMVALTLANLEFKTGTDPDSIPRVWALFNDETTMGPLGLCYQWGSVNSNH